MRSSAIFTCTDAAFKAVNPFWTKKENADKKRWNLTLNEEKGVNEELKEKEWRVGSRGRIKREGMKSRE